MFGELLFPQNQEIRNPKKQHLSCFDKTVIASTVFIWIFLFNKIPTDIPFHYNDHGEVECYRSGYCLYIIPVVDTFLP
jgi:hypothetical protein